MDEIFPNLEIHRERLRQTQMNSTGGLDRKRLNDTDRWAWHAYDYAWRRVWMGDARGISPIDPKGEWYNPTLADQAEAWYRGKTPAPRPRNPSWRNWVAAAYRWKHERGETLPRGLDDNHPLVIAAVREWEEAEQIRTFDQDKARAKARIVGNGKNPDGSPTPEALAFVELCVKQYKANIAGFVERNRKAFRE